ncbi:MAG: methyltransferase domain-containing protein [Micrococcaceae bacterium]
MHDFNWDPAQYAKFSDHRARPFKDLTSVIDEPRPRVVIDLGCGPGTMTRTLAERWPDAEVIGLDSSEDMVLAARRMQSEDPQAPKNLRFEHANASEWMPDASVDVVVSNAMLQWIPQHRQLMGRWLKALKPGAWFGMQVPGNYAAPSHATINELARRPEYADASRGTYTRESIYTPLEYAETLIDAGLRPNVWETTYLQSLLGEEPVYAWVRGAALRPVLQGLSAADERDGTRLEEQYTREYREAMLKAYPPYEAPDGTTLTVFSMRRVFVVGQKVLDYQI